MSIFFRSTVLVNEARIVVCLRKSWGKGGRKSTKQDGIALPRGDGRAERIAPKENFDYK